MTRPVLGVDGVERRWVYLHYFKDGQPSINWLDPSFAGMRLVIGDALHSLTDLGSGGCGWTPTASWARRRPPPTRTRGGRKGIHSRRRPTI